MVVKSQR